MAATTVNPAVLNALTLKWGQDRANLDDQQNRLRINYQNALGKMQRGYNDTDLKAREGYSDRGMFQSGPALAGATKLRDEYNRQQAEAGQLYNTNLATLARRRLEGQQQYNNDTLLAQMGISLK